LQFPYVTVKQRDFLVFRDLTMLWCFPGLGMADKVVPSILRAHWVHIRALSGDIDASGSFLGVSEGAKIPYVTVKQRDFLVFRDFDDIVVFSRAGYG
jgi:hypothetical protein